MTFGPYKNFKDCVAKNGSKDNPAAYCTSVHKRITGKFPSESSEQSDHGLGEKLLASLKMPFSLIKVHLTDSRKVFAKYSKLQLQVQKKEISKPKAAAEVRKMLDWNLTPDAKNWLRKIIKKWEGESTLVERLDISSFGDMQFILDSIPIFSIGEHTDSRGSKRAWSVDDLQAMITAFDAKVPSVVPIKLGHTSDAFNSKVANALDIPEDILKGEGSNNTGAARLGEVIGLHLDKGVLHANIEASNSKVADLIKGGYFTGVSSEIQREREFEGKTYGPVLSGLALLGAQRPALGELHNALVGVMDEVEPDYIYLSEVNTKSIIKWAEAQTNPRDATWSGISGAKSANVTWKVPIQEAASGRLIQAVVSAPDQISARSTALRVVENFLLNASGPAGTILGSVVGLLGANRLLAKTPRILKVGIIGQLLFSEFQGEGATRYVVMVRDPSTGKALALATSGNSEQEAIGKAVEQGKKRLGPGVIATKIRQAGATFKGSWKDIVKGVGQVAAVTGSLAVTTGTGRKLTLKGVKGLLSKNSEDFQSPRREGIGPGNVLTGTREQQLGTLDRLEGSAKQAGKKQFVIILRNKESGRAIAVVAWGQTEEEAIQQAIPIATKRLGGNPSVIQPEKIRPAGQENKGQWKKLAGRVGGGLLAGAGILGAAAGGRLLSRKLGGVGRDIKRGFRRERNKQVLRRAGIVARR